MAQGAIRRPGEIVEAALVEPDDGRDHRDQRGQRHRFLRAHVPSLRRAARSARTPAASTPASAGGKNDRMTGRAILVTGAARGIGKAVAQAFADSGDRVAIHYRASAQAAEHLRRTLPGDGHMIVRADMADPDSVRAMVDGAADALGGLDVLVNNAGVYAPHAVLASSYEEWQQQWRLTLDTNLVGAANAIWCAVRHMPNGGRIVNVSSRGAFRGEPNHVAYGASKAGLN